MKKILTFVACLIAFVGICKADDDRPIRVDQLPEKAQLFIKQHFPKREISLAKMEKELLDRTYEIIFANGDKVEFDKRGDWKEVSCPSSTVPSHIVPRPIRANLLKRYPKAGILKIERDSNGYEVKLDNWLELTYNTEFQLTDIED